MPRNTEDEYQRFKHTFRETLLATGANLSISPYASDEQHLCLPGTATDHAWIAT